MALTAASIAVQLAVLEASRRRADAQALRREAGAFEEFAERARDEAERRLYVARAMTHRSEASIIEWAAGKLEEAAAAVITPKPTPKQPAGLDGASHLPVPRERGEGTDPCALLGGSTEAGGGHPAEESTPLNVDRGLAANAAQGPAAGGSPALFDSISAREGRSL